MIELSPSPWAARRYRHRHRWPCRSAPKARAQQWIRAQLRQRREGRAVIDDMAWLHAATLDLSTILTTRPPAVRRHDRASIARRKNTLEMAGNGKIGQFCEVFREIFTASHPKIGGLWVFGKKIGPLF